ncbi:MAG: (2Fe-2S)-binding protein [Firmicutes bacterium]|nr:(2Fe-2S)-binding protein [Bacillota bacterium]
MTKKVTINFTVNGDRETREAVVGQTLLKFIREDLHLTGTKEGCEIGECGACTVLLDGKPVNSCLVLAVELEGKELVTIEGLSKNGELDKLQHAFIDKFAFQCGYCTPGMIMASKALLDRNPNPTDEDINEALSGNLCRCGAYQEIREAIKASAKQ